MQDAWRAYLELAFGLTEASRRKAQQVVKDLVGKGEATAGQVQQATAELVSASKANREALTRLVRYEVDRALGAVGLATADEVDELSSRVRDLERRVRHAEQSGVAAPQERPAKAAKKTVAKKTAKKSTSQRSAAKQAGQRKSTAGKSTTGQSA